MLRRLALTLSCLLALPAFAAQGMRFDSIDGGTLALEDWRGKAVLVVNTASRCGFTSQYDGLQALQDRFAEEGLVVLTVPSNDFRQELATEEDVKEFCEVNFGLTLPMTTITPVTGPKAHPFYTWLRDTHGVEPVWNFNKVLIDPEGRFAGFWGSSTRPLSRALTQAIERAIEQALP
jgi:glutathione peroxidase